MSKERNKEVWVDVVGYEGIYKVSNMGNIISCDRTIYNKGSNCYQKIKGCIRKKVIHKNGYEQVMMSNGINKLILVHRIVAEAFIPNKLNKKEVNHINGIKNDNRVENLEWCTRMENEIHSIQNKLKDNGRKVIDTETKQIFNSVKEAAEFYNIKRTSLSRYLTGFTKNKTKLTYLYE